MENRANRLGKLLLEAGLIDQFQLDSALSMQRNLGGQIGAALVKLGYLPESTILEFLESQQRFAKIDLGEIDIDPSLMTLLPIERMRLYQVLPIELRKQGHEKILRLAMADPTDLHLIDDLQFSTGCKILPLLAAVEDILGAIEANRPEDPVVKQTVAALEQDFQGSFAGLSSSDNLRLDRLLRILYEKGILSLIEVERINGD